MAMNRRMCKKKQGKHAKFWIGRAVTLEFSQRYRPHEVNEIRKLVERHQSELLEAWNGFFGR